MNSTREKIKSGFENLSKNFNLKDLNELKNLVLNEWDRQKQANERMALIYSKIVPLEKRYVKMVTIQEKNAKVTFRPSDGEILIKIPKETPEFKIEKMKELGEYLVKNIPANIPTTLRATLKWSNSNSFFRASLISNSKNFKFSVNPKHEA